MAASSTSPLVLRDPRFEAGRALIQQGMANEGAIEIFSTLVEECIAKHGETSIETSPAFFEYGNSLLRAYMATTTAAADEEPEASDAENADDARNAAAAAAEARQQAQQDKEDPTAAAESPDEDGSNDKKVPAEPEPDAEENGVHQDEAADDGETNESESDLQLSLEMMENAYSIMEEYKSQTNTSYVAWVTEQIPRVLLGIGDCLSALQRHADAADAYSRALDCRQLQLDEIAKSNTKDSLMHLTSQRRVCEATVLIAEELLACPENVDVVTTETSSLIVKANERIEYARGYYDKARDSLQETVYLLGKLASKNVDLGSEKEDVCFLATMIMGVGETLAALDEQEAEAKLAAEPVNKKAKR